MIPSHFDRQSASHRKALPALSAKALRRGLVREEIVFLGGSAQCWRIGWRRSAHRSRLRSLFDYAGICR